MFDFAWSEIALIVVVAVIFIGPKDLPVAIKAVTGMLKKARRMAGEFQTHVDEMVREADLGEVRDGINKIRNFDFKGTVERAVDPDGSLRTTFASNPLEPSTPATTVNEPVAETAPDAAAIEAHSAAELTRPEGVDTVAEPEAEPETAPAFIPPGYSLPDYLSPPKAAPAEVVPPAFVPPSIAALTPPRLS
jgi:sec-independent protein translocase protein TatB